MKHLALIGLMLSFLNSCNFQSEKKTFSVDIITNDEGEVSDIKIIRSKVDSNYIHLTFFQDGEIQMLREFEAGKMNGKYFRWRDNGRLSIEGYVVDGDLDGVTREVYEDGRTMFEGKRIENKFEGINSSFYKSGAIERQWNRAKSQDFGRSVYYYENGMVKEIGNHTDSGYILIGKWDENGEKIE